MPVFSKLLAVPLLWNQKPFQLTPETKTAQAIIILDAGSVRFRQKSNVWLEEPNIEGTLRALEAVRVYQLLEKPIMVVSGGDPNRNPDWLPEASALKNILINLGVAHEDIILDSYSNNTHDHAKNIVRILREKSISDFVLVTSATHMRRALAAFRQQGVSPLPSPADTVLSAKQGWDLIILSQTALEFSRQVMYEYFGILYYRLNGWI